MKIKVTCNSVLAETLINIKREEINNIEKIYNANIDFSFDNHFSLHKPLIEIVENKIISKVNEEKNTKSKKRTKITKITKLNNNKAQKKKETKGPRVRAPQNIYRRFSRMFGTNKVSW